MYRLYFSIPSDRRTSNINMALFQLLSSLLVFACVADLAFGQGGYLGRQPAGSHRCSPSHCPSCHGGVLYHTEDSFGCQICRCRRTDLHVQHQPAFHDPHQPVHIGSHVPHQPAFHVPQQPVRNPRCPPNNSVTTCVVRPNQCSIASPCPGRLICCPVGCNSLCVRARRFVRPRTDRRRGRGRARY